MGLVPGRRDGPAAAQTLVVAPRGSAATEFRITAAPFAARKAVIALCITMLAAGALLPDRQALAVAAAAAAAVALRWALGVDWEAASHVRGLGVELSRRRRCGVRASRFVPLPEVEDVILAEGMTSRRVFFFLGVQRRGGAPTAVAFRALRPRLALLRRVYAGLQPLVAADLETLRAEEEEEEKEEERRGGGGGGG